MAIAPDDVSDDGAPRVRETFKTIVEASRLSATNNPFVFFAGGSGSLNLPDGKGRLIDNFPPDFPPFVRKKSQQHCDALPYLKQEVHDVPWTYLSPCIKLNEPK